jgi:hypothetical protein
MSLELREDKRYKKATRSGGKEKYKRVNRGKEIPTLRGMREKHGARNDATLYAGRLVKKTPWQENNYI